MRGRPRGEGKRAGRVARGRPGERHCWAKRGVREGKKNGLAGWVAVGLGLVLGLFLFSNSFPLFFFLFQTKLILFEFKFEFEFKPHSIK